MYVIIGNVTKINVFCWDLIFYFSPKYCSSNIDYEHRDCNSHNLSAYAKLTRNLGFPS